MEVSAANVPVDITIPGVSSVAHSDSQKNINNKS